jgi:hypothetical protein
MEKLNFFFFFESLFFVFQSHVYGRFIVSRVRAEDVDIYMSSNQNEVHDAYVYKNVLSRRKSKGLQDRLYRRYNFPQVIIICKGHTLSLITQAMTSQENNGLNRRRQ